MSGEGFILDTPDQIQAFVLLQIFHKLKLEVEHPNGPTWRDSPMKQAQQVLDAAGRPFPGRTKKKVLSAYEAYLTEAGIR
jgi:hypothetical protein